MARPPPLPKSHINVPIIGQKKFDESITFDLAQFSFHPPVKFDDMYVAMMGLLVAGSPNIYKFMHAFDGQFNAYLTEDCELGKKHTLVVISTSEEGRLIVVPYPTEDDPGRGEQIH